MMFVAAVLLHVMALSSVEIIAHRGASHDAPENTLGAIQAGYEQGADACELDIHLTRDGRIIVMHDADTFRTTGVSNRISKQNWRTLRRLDVAQWGRWEGRGFSEPAPLLQEVLPWIPEGKRLFIEIKCGREVLPELDRVIRRSKRAPAELALIGFNYQTMREAKRAMPGLQVYWLVNKSRGDAPMPSAAELIRRARAAGFDGLNLNHQFAIDNAFVSEVKAAGLKLFTWTVDDPEVARAHVEAGVDGITTNRPEWLRDQLTR